MAEQIKHADTHFERIRQTKDSLREMADNWRANRPFEYEGGQGYVIIFGDSVPGWKRDLDRPEGWEPGCVAVGVNGDLHLATGGNSYDGATAWEQVVDGKQKPTHPPCANKNL